MWRTHALLSRYLGNSTEIFGRAVAEGAALLGLSAVAYLLYLPLRLEQLAMGAVVDGSIFIPVNTVRLSVLNMSRILEYAAIRMSGPQFSPVRSFAILGAEKMRRTAAIASLLLLLLVPSQSFALDEEPVGTADATEVVDPTAATPQEAEKEPPAGKLSGYAFFDAYAFASNHREDIEGQTGFWFRRIYLAYDRKLGKGLDARLRLEMNSAGDFESGDKMNPFVKDAYVRWRGEQTSVIVGMSGTPTWGFIEGFWGYRSVEKTPLDLQKWGSSRDIGVAVKGTLGANEKLSYHVMAGNGNSNKAEVSAGKAVHGALAYQLSDDLVIQVLAEYNKISAAKTRTTYQAFAGYESRGTKIGVHYAHQTLEVTSKDTEDSDLLSVFWTQKLADKLSLLLRGDRMFDPNPSGNKIAYLPFDPASRSFFVLAGIDFDYGSGIHLIPNVEYITYQPIDSSRDVSDDLALRTTVYWRF